MPIPPPPHPSGARPPDVPADLVPRHVAIVMDGNGRWANARGLPRTAGHAAGDGPPTAPGPPTRAWCPADGAARPG